MIFLNKIVIYCLSVLDVSCVGAILSSVKIAVLRICFLSFTIAMSKFISAIQVRPSSPD